MIVAIHQPQYLPWTPYFSKLEECDLFIFLDSVDFQKNGLQNRNQIKTAQGAQWLTVPVKQHLGQKINDVIIDNHTEWRRKHWETIRQCYGRAHAFKAYADELESLYSHPWTKLSELNIELTVQMMRWMGIDRPTIKSSDMQATGTASELVLNLCIEAGATCYLSGAGGRNYLHTSDFTEAGISLIYREPMLPTQYPQLFANKGFLNSLSAIDIILNCGGNWRQFISSETTT